MRIAVAGLHTESSTYNPVLTGLADFRCLRGSDLLGDPYFGFLADFPAQWLPVLHARALPGGPVAAAAHAAFRAEILQGVARALPLDGLYLAMHGAMFVQGCKDAEGDLLAALRALVGPSCLIAASYDLHGNLSQRIIDALDIFASYRTAPHVDVGKTMRRAVAMLLRAWNGGARPHVVWAPVPLLLPGERTSTVDEPAKGFYAGLAGHEDADVWDASFQVGYVWADEARATAAAVVTGTNRKAMVAAAQALAADYWGHRHGFRFGVPTAPLTDTLAAALASTTHPVILADSGDNPTGGGVGDRADVLAALVAVGAAGVIVAGIADALATDTAYAAGAGARATFRIGGSLDGRGVAVEAAAEVVFVAPADAPVDRQAVLRIGGIRVVVTARRRPFHSLSDFAALGLDPALARIVVVKSGYLSPDLAPLARPALMGLTAGVVEQDVERLENLHRKHPCFPFDGDFDWQPVVFASAQARGQSTTI